MNIQIIGSFFLGVLVASSDFVSVPSHAISRTEFRFGRKNLSEMGRTADSDHNLFSIKAIPSQLAAELGIANSISGQMLEVGRYRFINDNGNWLSLRQDDKGKWELVYKGDADVKTPGEKRPRHLKVINKASIYVDLESGLVPGKSGTLPIIKIRRDSSLNELQKEVTVHFDYDHITVESDMGNAVYQLFKRSEKADYSEVKPGNDRLTLRAAKAGEDKYPKFSCGPLELLQVPGGSAERQTKSNENPK